VTNPAKRHATLAALVLSAAALVGCSAAPAQPVAGATPTPTVSPAPTPSYLTELPEWALGTGMPWFIYPDDFECFGTEGCPNDYVAFFGEPGPVLPDGVEYYDPAIHGDMVTPVDK
jgi:hypothetical protein